MKCFFHKLKLGKIAMRGFSLATGLRKGCVPPTHLKMHLEYVLRMGNKWNDMSISTGKRANSFLQLKLQLDVY
jgi:hypothetical protein